jgi:methionine-rich copper-binding protein CopC
MAQTENARDEETERLELEANEQTQTPFSRQAGYNQPLPHEEKETAERNEQQAVSTLEVKPINPT